MNAIMLIIMAFGCEDQSSGVLPRSQSVVLYNQKIFYLFHSLTCSISKLIPENLK